MKQENTIAHKNCPVCGSNEISDFIKVESYRISGNYFMIKKCGECSHQFTSPIPDASGVKQYYKADNYISHTNSNESVFDKAYGLARKAALLSKKKILEKRVVGRSLLDYGCGTGTFLKYMSDNNWNVVGVEPSEEARSNAPTEITDKLFGLENFDGFKPGQFDAITLWHVFEHLYNPEEMLGQFSNLLTDKGKLFIAVPNPESFDAITYKEHWAAYDVPLHVSHFSKESMTFLVKKAGLCVAEILNMPMDSYYISMLSEENRSGKKRLLNSVKNGLLSNIKAQGDKNASSLIYIIEKA